MIVDCKVCSSYEDFIGLKDYWPESDSRYFETDFNYLASLYNDSISEGEPLTIIFIDSTGERIILNGTIEDRRYSPKIAYFMLSWIKFKKRCFLVRPYSVLGNIKDDKTAKAIMTALSIYCHRNHIDYVYFTLLPRDSIFAKYLENIKNILKRDPASLTEEHFILNIPGSLEDYLKTKDAKSRYNLKRIIKQLESEFNNDIEVKMFTDIEDVDVFYEHAENISQKSHLRPLNVGFRSTPNEIRKKKILAGNNLFRSYILYLHGKPSAFISGILYKKSFFTEHIGFDIQYERFSIGSYLLLKTIDDLAINQCADLIDFSYGSDSYKKRFSSSSTEDIRIRLFIPKASNLIFMLTIFIFTSIEKIARNILKKTGIYIKVRKVVRGMLRVS